MQYIEQTTFTISWQEQWHIRYTAFIWFPYYNMPLLLPQKAFWKPSRSCWRMSTTISKMTSIFSQYHSLSKVNVNYGFPRVSIPPRNTHSYSQLKNKLLTSCICLLCSVSPFYIKQTAYLCCLAAHWKSLFIFSLFKNLFPRKYWCTSPGKGQRRQLK